MNDFSKTIKITPDQVSPFQEIKPSAILKIAQDISVEHVTYLGYPRAKTNEKGIIWVVGKNHVEIFGMPKYDNSIVVSTYSHKTKFVIFPRTVEIRNEQGDLLIRVSSIWSLIDVNKRKMVNPVEYDVDIPDLSNGREFHMPFAIGIPFDLDNETTIQAQYSFCDMNGHINNTSYLDIAENIMPIDFLKNNHLKGFDIKYTHEVPLGSSLPIKYGFKDDSYYFVGDAFQLAMKY